MPKFEVLFYQTTTGKQPAKEFLLSLDIKMRAKMSMIISILQDNGYELREPYSAKGINPHGPSSPSRGSRGLLYNI